MKAFVGIVTCGSPTLPECVRSVRAQGLPVEIAIWNNGTSPVKEVDVVLLCCGHNAGVAAAWNGLARQAWARGYDRLVLLNDDVVLEGPVLGPLLEAATKGPVSLHRHGFCCFALPQLAWVAVGEFDEGFWPGYDEDADYVRRCLLAGLPEAHVHAGPIKHYGGMSTKTDPVLDDLVARAVPLLRERYRAKWGGPAGEETFTAPWDGAEPWPSTKQGLEGGNWPGRRLRVLFELTHTGVDREIIRGTGFDFDCLGGWGNLDRPRPQNMRLVDQPEGPYDVAVVESAAAQAQVPAGVPMVLKCHNDVGGVPPNLERAAAFVALCRESLVRWGVGPRGRFINHGIDADLFKGWRGGNGRVLSVGSALPSRPEKGPDVLRDVGYSVPVSLLGDYNEALDTLDLLPYCRTAEALVEAYSLHDVYFNPCEIVGSSTLEAMACGCPVVTMTPANYTDLLEHGRNCIFSPSPAHAKADLLRLLTDRPLAEKLGAQARADVREQLSVARCGGRWGKLLLDVSGRGTYAGWH